MRAPRLTVLVGAAVIGACGFVAAVHLHRSGVALPTVVAGWLALVGFRYAASQIRTWRVASAATEVTDRTRPDLVSTVREVSERIGVSTPRVLLLESDEPFAEVRWTGRTPIVVLARSVSVSLDPSALAGILAHELAHLDGRDFHRQCLLGPVIPLVGFTVFWSAFLAGRGAEVRLAGTVVFWSLWVGNAYWPAELVRLGMGLLVELPLFFVLAATVRAEEYLADERATTAITDASSYFEALVAMEAATSDAGPSDRSEDRDLLDAAFASHPSIESRASRLDVSVETLDTESGPAGRPTE